MEVKKEVVKLLNYSYRYLSYRMRTEYELRTYLLGKAEHKKIPSNYVDEVVNRLKEDGYINDMSFVEEFIHSRSTSKPKSEFVLTLELKQKGIDEDVIKQYFEKYPLDEMELAAKALRSKWLSYRNYNSEERNKKATNFLLRRGFTFSIIKKTIEEFSSEE